MTIKRDDTGRTADERALWINLGIVQYGTNDRKQGAAIVFALFILLAIGIVSVLALFVTEAERLSHALQWLCNAFLFVLGVATGTSNSLDRS